MVVALIALVVAVGGVAFATIPDSQGTIHGCYLKANGSLRVAESASDCRSSELPIQWNQTGPTGPTGLQGPPGSGGQTVAFDEKPGEVTTQSNTPVDLGGPSVTVTVPPSGLIAVFARATPSSPPSGEADVLLSEPTDFDPPVRLLAACCSNTRTEWTEPGGAVIDRLKAGWLVLEATPGTHTYKLVYQEAHTGGTSHFSNRKLWVAPLG
jgi:hypothetical protein